MARTQVWSALQPGQADAICFFRAASRQSQSHLPAGWLDNHRAAATHSAAGGFRASIHSKICLESCDQHACIQSAANTTKSKPDQPQLGWQLHACMLSVQFSSAADATQCFEHLSSLCGGLQQCDAYVGPFVQPVSKFVCRMQQSCGTMMLSRLLSCFKS